MNGFQDEMVGFHLVGGKNATRAHLYSTAIMYGLETTIKVTTLRYGLILESTIETDVFRRERLLGGSLQ